MIHDIEKNTGRQDVQSPDVTSEPSDPPVIDQARGQRMILGIAIVGIILIVAAIIVVTSL